MSKFIRDLFTGVDGSTWDAGRLFLAIGVLVMAAGGVGSIIKGSLDFVAFGAGFGGLLTGGGALLLMKRDTEPKASFKQQDDGKGNVKTQTEVTGLPGGEGQ